MSRALVVSTSNYYLFKYWYANFEKWSPGIIDMLYIGNNTGVDIVLNIEKYKVINGVKYPKNVETLLKDVAEDQVLIMHDDVFVYDANYVRMCFDIAERKIVSPVHNSHNGNEQLENAMVAKFGHHNSFFPYFVFAPMVAVRHTSYNLNEYKAEQCPILGVPAGGDQGFLFGLELQNAGFPLFPIARYLAHEYPVNPPWVHAQGLSYNFLANISSGVDEYKTAWLIKLVGMDLKKIDETYLKLFGEETHE
jgi:hypothetical protein